MVEDMETQRATYQTLRSTQDQQLQDATKQLAAARQQGRDAVTAAEARAAAERQPLENAVLQLQNQLNATQLDLDRVTAQLDTTDAKFGDLVKKLARAGKEKEKAAAGLAAATTTNATLLKDKLQLEATIQSLQVEKDGIMLSTVGTC
jgi:chromosome segregation ATPase